MVLGAVWWTWRPVEDCHVCQRPMLPWQRRTKLSITSDGAQMPHCTGKLYLTIDTMVHRKCID